MTMKETNRILVGQIIAPHGVRGDVRVSPLTDRADRFAALKCVFMHSGAVLTLERAGVHKGLALLHFQGVDTVEAAEKLRGQQLYIDRKDALPLAAGQYYTADILGLRVVDERTGEELGEIVQILETGSNDVYVVRHSGRSQDVLVPALKSVVSEVSLPEGLMRVRLQEVWE